VSEETINSEKGERIMARNMKRIVVALSFALVMSIALVSLGIAYTGGIRGVGLLGVWFFMTFGIIVVLAQVIPAGILFASLMGGVFSSTQRSEMPVKAV
jgi:hypothetical protein